MDKEASNVKVRLHLMLAFRKYYFNAETSIRYWYFIAVFHLHLIRVTYLRIIKAK